MNGLAHPFKSRSHDLWTVIDSENDVSHTSCCQSFDLMLDHGLIGKFYQRLWESEGLADFVSPSASNKSMLLI